MWKIIQSGQKSNESSEQILGHKNARLVRLTTNTMLFAPRGFIYYVHFCYIRLCYSEAALVILLFIGLVITKKDNKSKDVDAHFSIRKSFGTENSLN